jgi:hypothetical protein
MSAFKILVVRMGGGYLKAILLDGQETVWGRDEQELAGRLKRRPDVSRMLPRRIEQALDLAERK